MAGNASGRRATRPRSPLIRAPPLRSACGGEGALMIDVRLYRPGHVEAGIDPADISELVHKDGCVLWVDVDDFGPAVVAQLAEEFSLHPLALEDAQKQGQRPKIERYPSHNFLVAVSA